MYVESQSIEQFVRDQMARIDAVTIIQNWRVDPENIIEFLVRDFRDMGCFTVRLAQRRILSDALLQRLRHSVEIKQMVEKAQREERRRVNVKQEA